MLLELSHVDSELTLISSSLTTRFTHTPEKLASPVQCMGIRRVVTTRSKKFESSFLDKIDSLVDDSTQDDWNASLKKALASSDDPISLLADKMFEIISDIYSTANLTLTTSLKQILSNSRVRLTDLEIMAPLPVDVAFFTRRFDQPDEPDIDHCDRVEPFTPSMSQRYHSYEDLAEELHTGDVVLLRSKTIAGAIIRIGSNSEWSHVGLVINPKDCSDSDSSAPKHLLLFESSTNRLSQRSFVTGNAFYGVSIVSLRPKIFSSIYTYGAVAKLQGNVDRQKLLEVILDVKQDLFGRPYEQSMLQLVRSIFGDSGILRNRKVDLSSVFCSELVAEVFQRAGLLSKVRPSSSFVPEDFVPDREIDWLGDVSLGDLKYIDGLSKANKSGGYAFDF
ncbi:hypothetical protein GEMRC1_003276 [Eukaryota sp. GEM-RC1]